MLKADLRTTNTRERVILEARRLYEAGGYNHLNLDVIARTLKITRPALYFHFPDGKEQHLQEVIEAFGTEIVGQLHEAIVGCATVKGQLRSILLYVTTKPLIDSRELCQAELEDLHLETRKKLQDVFQNISQVIAGIVEEGINGGELRPVDLNIAVFSFMSLCQQVEQFVNLRLQLPQETCGRFPEKVEDMVDGLLDLWFDGISSPAKK